MRSTILAGFRALAAVCLATTFALAGREHLRYVSVQTTDVSAYRGLLAGGVA